MADRFAAVAVAFATGAGHGDRREVARRGPARRAGTSPPTPAGAGPRSARCAPGVTAAASAAAGVITKRGLVVGRDHRGRAVHIPVGGAQRPAHARARRDRVGQDGHPGVDRRAPHRGRARRGRRGPQGRPHALRDELHRAARRTRREFREWTPEGPDAYNPFAHGSDTELADKALAGETYTEPHYLRQAQRYLGHATRTLRAAGQPVTLATLAEAMSPRRLEAIGRRPRRRAPGPGAPRLPRRPLTRATTRTGRHPRPPRDPRRIRRRAMAAAPRRGRDRASTCCARSRPARSSTSAWTPTAGRCWPPMIAAAIVQDLLTVAAHQQHQPLPTLVLRRRVLRRRARTASPGSSAAGARPA